MTVVQFQPRAQLNSVVIPEPAGAISNSQFEEAHEIADEAERLPPMSDAVAKFIAAAKARISEVSGDIETELQAMSERQVEEMSAAMIAICDQEPVDLEDDFIGDLVAFEVAGAGTASVPTVQHDQPRPYACVWRAARYTLEGASSLPWET